MKKKYLFSVLAVLLQFGVLAQEDEELLRKLEYDWLMAEFKVDTATISRMMDEKFIFIGLTGISSKQQELEGIYNNMSQRKKNHHVVDSLYFEDWHVKFHGMTAIVTFISVTKGKVQGVAFANRKTRMYDVWVKRNDQWKAVSSQVTPISIN